MRNEAGLRGWHAWWSVALALPILIVSLTAVFIAHGDSLGLKGTALPSGLRLNPGDERTARAVEVRALHEHDKTIFVGTKYGLLVQQEGRLDAVPELAGLEIRGLATVGPALFAAAMNGVWALHAGKWKRVYSGGVWSVNALQDGAVAIATNSSGLLLSRDGGQSWTSDDNLNDGLSRHVAAVGPQKYTLHRLIMDMHTGKAFFGKKYEWLWIDAVSGTMLFLTFSGLFIWWRSRRKKRQMVQRLQSPASKPAAA